MCFTYKKQLRCLIIMYFYPMNFRLSVLSIFIALLVLDTNGQGNITNLTINDGLSQNNVTQLLFDNDHYLWVGTNSGLCVYNGKSFYRIEHTSLSPRISHLFMNKRKEFYIADEYGNFFNYYSTFHQRSYKTPIINDFKIVPLKKAIDLDNNVSHSYELKKKGSASINELLINYEITPDHYKNNFFKIGNIFLDLNSKGYIKSYTASGKVKLLKTNLNQNFLENGLFFDSENDLFGLFDHAIHKLMVRNDSLIAVKLHSNVSLNKVENKINEGVFDPQNGIFIFGSYYNGLYIFKPAHFSVLKIGDEKKLKQRNHSIFYSHVEFENRDILVNSNILFDSLGKYKILNFENTNIRALAYKDVANNIWHSDGNKIIIKQHSAFDTIALDYELNGPINMTTIDATTKLISDYNKLLLLKKDKIVNLITAFNSNKNERFNFLYRSETDLNTYILTNKNICLFNINNYSLDTLDNLPECDYRNMSSLSDKYTFIGTYGQGFFIYDGKKWHPMPLDKKGHLKFAHAALCDAHGHVWISTNNGLFRTRLQDMTDYITGKSKNIFYFYYDKSSGFLTNEFNGGCQSPAIKLKDGRFSFSSMDGLVQFDPLNVPSQFPQRPLHIIYVTLNGKTLDSIPSTLIIDQKIKDIKLEVGTAFYGHPDNLEIQYKISGYVDQWIDITDQRYITIQNATYGSFNIEIRKRNGFGNDDFDYISYPVAVLPYFYQTWWFLFCIGLGFVLIIVIAARWYSRNLAAQKAKLEKMVQDRNKSLIDINISLEDKIKQNEMFHSIMVHDIKAPIFFIGTISNEILKSYDRLEKDDIKNNLETIRQASYSINAFIVDFLTWAKHRIRTNHFDKEQINILDIMKDLVSFHNNSDKIKRGRLIITINCDQSLCVFTNKQLLKIILNNLLSNSIKFSSQGTITLYAYLDTKDNIIIGCKDQGKGMDEKLMTLLTNDKYNGNSIREDSFRMGYVFINDIIKILNASINIQSQLGVGTDITIKIDKTT